MPRVLVVSYPWLPVFNAGVRHAAILCRYLPEAGWDPIVLTRDWSDGGALADDALRLSFEPLDESPPLRAAREVPMVQASFAARDNAALRWHAALAGGGGADEPLPAPRRFARAALEATYPLFGAYPDAFRGWVEPAVVAGIGAIRQYGIGAVISLSGPDSAHLAGGEIARRADIPWVPLFGELGTFGIRRGDGSSVWQRMQRRELARRWLRGASRAATVSPAMTGALQAAYGVQAETLTRTFDPDERRLPPRRAVGSPLRLVHLGQLAPERQPVHLLLEALDLLATEDAALGSSLQVEVIGSGCEDLLEALVAGRPAAPIVQILPRVTPVDAIRHQREADVLLLLDGAGEHASYPATLFEHLNARRPTIAVGGAEGGFVELVLRETRGGERVATALELAASIRAAMESLQAGGEVPFAGDEAAIARHSGPEQARRLAAMLDAASAERFGSWQRG
jgi:hypothetical protein